MAKQKMNEKRHPLIVNLSSDKQLDSELCSKMVIGVIKHILYTRDQIPQPFEQLLLPDGPSTAISSKQHIRDVRRNAMVQSLGELFNRLVEELEAERDVRRVVVALGGTFMSPKEIHCIEIPPFVSGRQPLSSSQRNISQIFRSLFVSSGAINWPDLTPTNVHVLLQMSRECSASGWFQPKTFYKLAENSPRLTIYRWNCEPTLDTSRSTPFQLYESPAVCSTFRPQQTKNAMQNDDEEAEDDLVWYLTPVTIKGFS